MISSTTTTTAEAPETATHPVFTARELCLTAAMTALVFVATFVPRIPIPLGYAHLGDAVIFLLALSIGRREALFAACLGSALSDVLGGFLLWAVPTLIIKFVMADIVWRIAGRSAAGKIRTLGAFLASSLWMAFAYTVFGAALYASVEAGLASTPGLLMEGLVNTAAAMLVLPALRKFLQR